MESGLSVNPSEIHPSPLDLKVLQVLVESNGRVVSRDFIARQAGIDNGSTRRVDSSLVAVRRWLGQDSVVTVRSRGWMLTLAAVQMATYILENFH